MRTDEMVMLLRRAKSKGEVSEWQMSDAHAEIKCTMPQEALDKLSVDTIGEELIKQYLFSEFDKKYNWSIKFLDLNIPDESQPEQ